LFTSLDDVINKIWPSKPVEYESILATWKALFFSENDEIINKHIKEMTDCQKRSLSITDIWSAQKSACKSCIYELADEAVRQYVSSCKAHGFIPMLADAISSFLAIISPTLKFAKNAITPNLMQHIPNAASEISNELDRIIDHEIPKKVEGQYLLFIESSKTENCKDDFKSRKTIVVSVISSVITSILVGIVGLLTHH
jgi:hypothetical protein